MKHFLSVLFVMIAFLSLSSSAAAQNPGDVVLLGRFEQDGNPDNGPEQIEWLVLAVEEDRALLTSVKGLQAHAYNNALATVTWETSTIRNWLNDSFYTSAFSENEKNQIQEHTVVNADGNNETGVSGGNNTQDRLFLLSIDEVSSYFASDAERCLEPTEYALQQDVYLENGTARWWLRSPGSSTLQAAIVKPDGSIGALGDVVNRNTFLVRPALWASGLSSNAGGVADDASLTDQGIAAYNRGDYTEALRCLQPEADGGNADAQYWLGMMYYNGEGVSQSDTTALQYFRKAGGQDHPDALFRLGTMYEYGRGVERSESMAISYYQRAADNGSVEAGERLTVLKGAPTATPVPTTAPAPTNVPTQIPTAVPTQVPTAVPTQVPTAVPTQVPTDVPTSEPIVKPDLGNLRVGGTVTMGRYEQDNNSGNGAEPIEWIVLAIEDGQALVISKFGLEVMAYNTERQSVTWETSSIRRWLNRDFYETAFNTAERDLIVERFLQNPDSPAHKTAGGDKTRDYVFLLSIEEVYTYFGSARDRQCTMTEYAKSKDGYASKENGNAVWWLRTPGEAEDFAARIQGDGSVHNDGWRVNYQRGVVRPAMWLMINGN